MAVKEEDTVPILRAFKGRQEFQSWKMDAQTTSMTYNFEFIVKGGQIVHNKIQMEVDPSLAPPVPGTNRVLKISVSDYPDSEWQDEMERTNFTMMMKDLYLSCMKKEMGHSTWNSRKKNRCGTTQELQQLQFYKVNQWLARKNRIFIQMLRKACQSAAAKSVSASDLDIITAIVFTQELDEVIAGTKWDDVWATRPQHMPAIKVWAKILLRFEGLNDAASTNFVFDLGELMDLSTGKNAKTVREIMSRTEKMLIPVSHNFGNVDAFVTFLVACVGAEAINRKAQSSGAEGRAYREANKWLISLRHDNIIMTQLSLEKAIRIAEENFAKSEPPHTRTMITDITEEQEEQPSEATS